MNIDIIAKGVRTAIRAIVALGALWGIPEITGSADQVTSGVESIIAIAGTVAYVGSELWGWVTAIRNKFSKK